METNYNREDLIDLYLLDKLSSQQRKNFEEEMLRDDDLRKEVEVTQRIITGFEHKGETEAIDAMYNLSEEQIKTIIAGVEKNRHKQSVKKTWLYPVIAGMVASIALLYIGFQPKYSSGELYDNFYAPISYEYIPSRGGVLDNERQHLLEQAIANYNQSNYAEALVLFDSIIANLEEEPVLEEVIFYMALCMAQTGKENAALKKLELIAVSSDSEFREDAQWNLALLYLKIGERNKCRNILKDITGSGDSPYIGDANSLLDKLDKRKWF